MPDCRFRVLFGLSDISQDLCARCVRGCKPFVTADVESGLVTSSDIRFGAKLRPREPRRFQELNRFSLNPNNYNNMGKLLALKQQPRWFQQMLFGHTFGTAKEQGCDTNPPLAIAIGA